jgi:hypothetical protein
MSQQPDLGEQALSKAAEAALVSRAFNSDYICQKLQKLEVDLNGKATTFDVEKVDFYLPGEGKVDLCVDVRSRETGNVQQAALTATLQMAESGDRAVLEEVKPASDRDISPEIKNALLSRASELLDLRHFSLQGMSLRLKNLKVDPGKVTLEADAQIEKVP